MGDHRCLFRRQINRPFSSALLGVKSIGLVTQSDPKSKEHLRRFCRFLNTELFRHLSIKFVHKRSVLKSFGFRKIRNISRRVTNCLRHCLQDNVLWEYLCNREIAFLWFLKWPASVSMVKCSLGFTCLALASQWSRRRSPERNSPKSMKHRKQWRQRNWHGAVFRLREDYLRDLPDRLPNKRMPNKRLLKRQTKKTKRIRESFD